jgi:hypothetical protein
MPAVRVQGAQLPEYSRHPAQIVVDSSFPHLYYSLDLHVLSRLWRMTIGHPTASSKE